MLYPQPWDALHRHPEDLHTSPGFAPVIIKHSQFRVVEVQWRYRCTATPAEMTAALVGARGSTGSGKQLYYYRRHGPAGWSRHGAFQFKVAGARYIYLLAGPLGVTTAFPRCTTDLTVIGQT